MLQSLLLSLRLDGPRATARLLWKRIYSDDERLVFVRYLKPPSTPVALPAEANGIVVRRMTERDAGDERVRRYRPREPRQPFDAVVAERDGRIVGAVWFTNAVGPEQPWYPAVAPHVKAPARLNENMYVVPGDKAAAWALGRTATDCLATDGVRTVIGVIGAHNKPSILMSRLLGGKVVARLLVRHRLGRTRTAVEAVGSDSDSGLAARPRA